MALHSRVNARRLSQAPADPRPHGRHASESPGHAFVRGHPLDLPPARFPPSVTCEVAVEYGALLECAVVSVNREGKE